MGLVYNLHFKEHWKTSFMNSVGRLTRPVKSIHKISILKGKLKVKVMERLHSCICRRWTALRGCLLKANEKATCQASCSTVMSASEMDCCLGGNDFQCIKTILVQELDCLWQIFPPILQLSLVLRSAQNQSLHIKNTVQTWPPGICILGVILRNNVPEHFSKGTYLPHLDLYLRKFSNWWNRTCLVWLL